MAKIMKNKSKDKGTKVVNEIYLTYKQIKKLNIEGLKRELKLRCKKSTGCKEALRKRLRRVILKHRRLGIDYRKPNSIWEINDDVDVDSLNETQLNYELKLRNIAQGGTIRALRMKLRNAIKMSKIRNGGIFTKHTITEGAIWQRITCQQLRSVDKRGVKSRLRKTAHSKISVPEDEDEETDYEDFEYVSVGTIPYSVDAMHISELKEELKARNLRTVGNKIELRERLRKAINIENGKVEEMTIKEEEEEDDDDDDDVEEVEEEEEDDEDEEEEEEEIEEVSNDENNITDDREEQNGIPDMDETGEVTDEIDIEDLKLEKFLSNEM